MPTQSIALSSAWTFVADGPAEVVFSFEDETGWFAVHTSSNPAGIANGHKHVANVPFTIKLGPGDFLHLRGRGTANVSEADSTEQVTVPASAAYGSGTREHNTAGITRQAVATASARVALPTLGPSREVYVMATQRCFFRTGDNAVVAAAGTSHPLATDERFYFRVPAGHTHIAYIRDTADGNITICAVV